MRQNGPRRAILSGRSSSPARRPRKRAEASVASRRRPARPRALMDREPLHPIPEGAERDPEQLGRRGAVEPRLLERLKDRFALNPVQVLLERPLGVGRPRLLDQRRRSELQVVGFDLSADRKRDRALEDVLELAGIPREVVCEEFLERGFGESPTRRVGLVAEARKDSRSKYRNVFPAFPEWRHAQLNHGKAVVEVLPKLSRVNQRREILMRRTDQPDID